MKVLIAAFCNERTVHYRGYTEAAVRRKIQDGVWRQGIEWRKAPDGHIFLDTEAIERWAEGEKAAA